MEYMVISLNRGTPRMNYNQGYFWHSSRDPFVPCSSTKHQIVRVASATC